MNLINLLSRREIWGPFSENQATVPSIGLRRYCLKDVLPEHFLGEIFLGFTANGRFLVSYSHQDVQFFVRFWAFPSHSSAVHLQQPFAQFSFKTYIDCPFQSDMPAVRFVQSLNDPDTFLFLVAPALDGDVLAIWGSLPQLECASCCKVATSLTISHNWSSLSDSPTVSCPQHMRLLRFYPDHQSFSFSGQSRYSGNFSEDAVESLDLPVVYDDNLPVPPCLTPSVPITDCKCFRLSTVALLHPSVCPKTGRLRLAWISQGRQVRVLSCSFFALNETVPSRQLLACSFPVGSCVSALSSSHSSSPTPLAFRAPLLTSNYCSACYCWPSEPTCSRYLQTSPYSLTRVSSLPKIISSDECTFHRAVCRVCPNEPWPDGHRAAILSKSRLIHAHPCNNFFVSEQSSGSSQRSRNMWTPALLSLRDSLTTCSPVSYLAMLQDIRASYIHWALVPIDSAESASSDRANNGQSERRQSLTRPEALLANQLCGQGHSYFDVTEWREAPIDEDGCWNPTGNHLLLAHMEEVVFDLCDADGEEEDAEPPERFLFVSPHEPDWLLVYDACPGEPAQPGPVQRDDLGAPWRSPSQRNLVALIDLAAGRQHDPEEPCYRTRVAALTATCPSQLRHHPDHPRQAASTGATSTLFELNNSLAVVQGCSLTHFTDPQGGYSIHLGSSKPGVMSLTDACRRRLSTSLNYGRYPVYPWVKLPQSVQYTICTRILPTALPSFVLVTEDGGQDTSGSSWRRVLLSSTPEIPEEISADHARIVVSPNSPIDSADRPRLLAVSANQLVMAMNAQTRLTFKSPSTVEISICLPESEDSTLLLNSAEDIQPAHSWEPFLWQCGLCVAQFTISDEHSMELVAAHLRLHLELRFCLKCNTVLPNSALAVDAPDAKPHRCKDLVTPIDITMRHQPHDQESILFERQQEPEESTQNPWRRYCQICRRGFSSPAQYSQHLKNVHKDKRFLCPDCGTSFSTKGNMTTHFQQVHNLSDSVSCPVCSKRCSNRYNLRRHISLVHAIKQRSSEAPSGTASDAEKDRRADHTDLSNDTDQSATITLTATPTAGKTRGYYLYMAPQKKTPQAAELTDRQCVRTSEALQASKQQTEVDGQQISQPSLVAEVSIVRSKRYAPIVSVQLPPAGHSKEIRLLQPLDKRKTKAD